MTQNTLDPERLPPVLTTEQYAALIGLSERTVRRHLKLGILPGAKKGVRKWGISRATAVRALQRMEGETNEQIQ